MHLTLPWGSTTEGHAPVPDLKKAIGATEYRTSGAELLAEGRGPVREARTTTIEVDPFPDRFNSRYGRHYLWHLLRDAEGRYLLVVNRRDLKPIGVLEAACRWASATHVFGAAPIKAAARRS